MSIVLEEHLKFDDHACFVYKKLNSVTAIIYEAKPYVSKATMTLLYMSLGWSQLKNGVLISGKSSVTLCNKIQAAHNRTVRTNYCRSDLLKDNMDKLISFDETYNFFAFFKLLNEIRFPTANLFFFRTASESCKQLGHVQKGFQLMRTLQFKESAKLSFVVRSYIMPLIYGISYL